MPIVDKREPAGWVSFRLTEPEAEVLKTMAYNLGVSRSAVIRAGIRVLWANPDQFGLAQPLTTAVAEAAKSVGPPAPPRKRAKRRKGKR